jgi:hypothetical protein
MPDQTDRKSRPAELSPIGTLPLDPHGQLPRRDVRLTIFTFVLAFENEIIQAALKNSSPRVQFFRTDSRQSCFPLNLPESGSLNGRFFHVETGRGGKVSRSRNQGVCDCESLRMR